MEKKLNQHQTEEILQSLDRVQKAKAPDYFYTRLEARMMYLDAPKNRFPILKPVLITMGLAFFIFCNLYTIGKNSSGQKVKIEATTEATIEDFANTYQL